MQVLYSTLVMNTKLLLVVMITPSNNFTCSLQLLALYPCRMIILMQYSMRLLETMPYDGSPQEKP